MINNFDKYFLLKFQSFRSIYLDQLMILLSDFRSWIPIIVFLLYINYKKHSLKSFVFFMFVGILCISISDFICSSIFKPYFQRLRPSHEPSLVGLVQIVGVKAGLYGFASSHASTSMALACFFTYHHNKSLKLTFIVWACLVSVSRIYLGVHYLTDVLVGAVIGFLSALILSLLTKKHYEV